MCLRAGALRDSGRVPLSLQKNAKGGEQETQLACGSNKCPLSSNAFSCEPRGSQLPAPRRPLPGGAPALDMAELEYAEPRVYWRCTDAALGAGRLRIKDGFMCGDGGRDCALAPFLYLYKVVCGLGLKAGL